jgi:hypothetical protein
MAMIVEFFCITKYSMYLLRENDSDDEEEEKKKAKNRTRNDNNDDDELDEDGKPQKLKVTMVGWNIDDTLVMTAINDHSLKVWCSFTGKLLYRLRVCQ